MVTNRWLLALVLTLALASGCEHLGGSDAVTADDLEESSPRKKRTVASATDSDAATVDEPEYGTPEDPFGDLLESAATDAEDPTLDTLVPLESP